MRQGGTVEPVGTAERLQCHPCLASLGEALKVARYHRRAWAAGCGGGGGDLIQRVLCQRRRAVQEEHLRLELGECDGEPQANAGGAAGDGDGRALHAGHALAVRRPVVRLEVDELGGGDPRLLCSAQGEHEHERHHPEEEDRRDGRHRFATLPHRSSWYLRPSGSWCQRGLDGVWSVAASLNNWGTCVEMATLNQRV